MTQWNSDDGRVRLFHGDCKHVLPMLGHQVTIITDPPFSARTHSGHDASANGHAGEGNDGANRKGLGYAPWTPQDVVEFMRAAGPVCSGWCVVMTDHTLAPDWAAAMDAAGRYTFAPLPYYAPGSRVRLSGDGPSSWTDWIIVSRTAALSRWGTLPGGYVYQSHYGRHAKMGGKPVGLMQDLVRDYSTADDVVCDPCMGKGTTALACINTGRRFVGIEKDEGEFLAAVERVRYHLGHETSAYGLTQRRMFAPEPTHADV